MEDTCTGTCTGTVRVLVLPGRYARIPVCTSTSAGNRVYIKLWSGYLYSNEHTDTGPYNYILVQYSTRTVRYLYYVPLYVEPLRDRLAMAKDVMGKSVLVPVQ